VQDFSVREGSRINVQPDGWGVDVDAKVVDTVRDSLGATFREMGFKERSFLNNILHDKVLV